MALFEVISIRPEVPSKISITAFKFTADVFVGLFTMFDVLTIVFTIPKD